MSKLSLIVKTKTKAGKRDEAKALWEAHLKPRLMDNPEQEVYFFCYDNQDEDSFYLIELYSSQAAFEKNAQQPWFWEYMKQAEALLDGQPEVSMTTPVWAKGVEV